MQTITRADGSTLTNSYDTNGNLTGQTDGANNTTGYTYDALDRLVAVTDPLNRTTSYSHDGAGNLTSLTDPLNRTTSYGYDNANRLTSISYSDGTTPNVSYGYDSDGQRTSMADGTGTSTYAYDSLHRLTSTHDGGARAIGYGYDLAGNATSITYPNGRSINRTFDQANRLANITDWLSGSTTFAYDANSNVVTTSFPAATTNVDSYGYNAADQLTSINSAQGSSTLANLSYTRDPAGLVTNETQTGLPGSASNTYSYTQLEQLATAGSNTYGYDHADNLTQLDSTGGYTYDAANQLTSAPNASYTYDQLGDRITATPTGQTQTTYAYNQAGQLITYSPPTGASTSFSYNGDGLRTSKTTASSTTSYTWDQNAPMPLLLSDGQNSYIYGPDGLPVEQVSQAGTPTYLHHDQLGSSRLITDQTGNSVGTFTYNPYGALTGSTGTTTTPLGYAAQYTDTETGLQYDRARYYDPSTGQFLTRDPVDETTREAYSYANGDPANAADPTGRKAILCGGLAGCRTIPPIPGSDTRGAPTRIPGSDAPVPAPVPTPLNPDTPALGPSGTNNDTNSTIDPAKIFSPTGALSCNFGNTLSSTGGISDILSDPGSLAGKNPSDVITGLGGVPDGWIEGALGQGAHKGQGWVLRQIGPNGEPTGRTLRYHPGGGHHGDDPYWRVSSPEGGKSDEIPASPWP